MRRASTRTPRPRSARRARPRSSCARWPRARRSRRRTRARSRPRSRSGAAVRRIAKPPATMSASASTSAGESGPHQNASGSARSGPSSRKHGTRPKFDGLKMWRPRNVDQVLREQRDGGRRREDPPAVHAPPVAVLGTRHAQDESDAVPGQERARRPHEHALASERDRDLEDGGREERDEDLGDRQAEAERRLSENLQRDDDRGEVQARVASRRKQDRVRLPRICSDGRPARAGALIGRSCYFAVARAASMVQYARVTLPTTRYDALIAELRAALTRRGRLRRISTCTSTRFGAMPTRSPTRTSRR